MRLFNQTTLFSISVLMLIGLTSAHSRGQLTTTLNLEESFVTNKTAVVDESGSATTISPGVSYLTTGAKSSLSIGYSLNAIYYDDLSQQDRVDHSLQLLSAFDHIPKRWNTSISGSIKQASVSAGDAQGVNSILPSDNSQELRTLGISSNLQGNLTNQTHYQSGINLDYADAESSEGSNSAGVNLGLSSNTQDKFSWGTTFTSNRTSSAGSESQIDAVQVNLNYSFNLHYSSFISADKSETDNNFLNDVNTNIGLVWTPNRNASLRLGIGERGNNTSYTLDSSLKTKQVTFQMNYAESITTSRALLINDAVSQQSPVTINQTLSIAPILVKTGSIVMTVNGKRSSVTFTYLQQTTTQNANNIGREIKESLSASASRKLSDTSSVQISLSRQETETVQEDTVDNSSLSYNKRISKSINASAALSNTEQQSNIAANQSRQQEISFRLNVVF